MTFNKKLILHQQRDYYNLDFENLEMPVNIYYMFD